MNFSVASDEFLCGINFVQNCKLYTYIALIIKDYSLDENKYIFTSDHNPADKDKQMMNCACYDKSMEVGPIQGFVHASALAWPHKGCITIPDFALFTALLYVLIPASASLVSKMM